MNNIIFIIGASSDIGLNLIKNIKDDALIIAHYHNSSQELEALAKEITNKMVLIKADLSSENEITNLINTIELEYGIPNKIIHLAAGKFENIRFKDINWNDFQKEIDISLKSLVMILNKFLPKLTKEKRGKVVCMLSSVTLGMPPKALSQYITIKYAMLGLLKALASEYANKNIQINAVSPSMIETKFLKNVNTKLVELNAYNHPLKRNARVEDVVPVIQMLLSKESDYMNGLNIPITGGSIF